MNKLNKDYNMAKLIHDQLNCTGLTENAVIPIEKENYRPKTIIDQTLEHIDPTPNIHTLFVQFNKKFFWNVLLPVQVKWSSRMTSCAGICTFHPRNKECIVSLSAPLLKLRSRKDLVETLLHEMIHAFLFLTNNNRDRDGHGPEFQKHMKRINTEAGTNITIYHSFHDEVKLYKQHWWRCDGPCQNRPPFFGTVKRSMNRVPGPNDFWWAEHVRTCNGNFIKIKEPEKKPKVVKKIVKSNGKVKVSSNSSLIDWMKKCDGNDKNTNKKIVPTTSQSPLTTWNKNPNPVTNVSTSVKKLGNGTNNVYGWGIAGPSGTSTTTKKSSSSQILFSGVLGGSSTGKSNLLDKFSKNTSTVTKQISHQSKPSTPIKKKDFNLFNDHVESNTKVNCPSCNKNVDAAIINSHLDHCLMEKDLVSTSSTDVNPSTLDKKRKVNDDPDIVSSHTNKRKKSNDDLEIIPGTSNENYLETDELEIISGNVNKKNPFHDLEFISSTPIVKKKITNDDTTSNRIHRNELNSNEVECPLCNVMCTPKEFNDHLDICLNKSSKNNVSIISLDDSYSESTNLNEQRKICFVCNKLLKPTETVKSHLDECISSVFDSETDFDFDDHHNSDDVSMLSTDKVPCPVCEELVDKSIMNEHLDTCLI